eukprot:Opistho-2@79875
MFRTCGVDDIVLPVAAPIGVVSRLFLSNDGGVETADAGETPAWTLDRAWVALDNGNKIAFDVRPAPVSAALPANNVVAGRADVTYTASAAAYAATEMILGVQTGSGVDSGIVGPVRLIVNSGIAGTADQALQTDLFRFAPGTLRYVHFGIAASIVAAADPKPVLKITSTVVGRWRIQMFRIIVEGATKGADRIIETYPAVLPVAGGGQVDEQLCNFAAPAFAVCMITCCRTAADLKFDTECALLSPKHPQWSFNTGSSPTVAETATCDLTYLYYCRAMYPAGSFPDAIYVTLCTGLYKIIHQNLDAYAFLLASNWWPGMKKAYREGTTPIIDIKSLPDYNRFVAATLPNKQPAERDAILDPMIRKVKLKVVGDWRFRTNSPIVEEAIRATHALLPEYAGASQLSDFIQYSSAGSTDVTSDIDINLKAPPGKAGTEFVVMFFNKAFRDKYNMESLQLYDVNLYSEDFLPRDYSPKEIADPAFVFYKDIDTLRTAHADGDIWSIFKMNMFARPAQIDLMKPAAQQLFHCSLINDYPQYYGGNVADDGTVTPVPVPAMDVRKARLLTESTARYDRAGQLVVYFRALVAYRLMQMDTPRSWNTIVAAIPVAARPTWTALYITPGNVGLPTFDALAGNQNAASEIVRGFEDLPLTNPTMQSYYKRARNSLYEQILKHRYRVHKRLLAYDARTDLTRVEITEQRALRLLFANIVSFMDALALEAYVTRGAVWYILSYVQIGKGDENLSEEDRGGAPPGPDPVVNLDQDLMLQAFHENIADAYKEFNEIPEVYEALKGNAQEAALNELKVFEAILNAAKYLQRVAFTYRRIAGKTKLLKMYPLWPFTSYDSWLICNRDKAAWTYTASIAALTAGSSNLLKFDSLMSIFQKSILVNMLKDKELRSKVPEGSYEAWIRARLTNAQVAPNTVFTLLREGTRMIAGLLRSASLGIRLDCFDPPSNGATGMKAACQTSTATNGNYVRLSTRTATAQQLADDIHNSLIVFEANPAIQPMAP